MCVSCRCCQIVKRQCAVQSSAMHHIATQCSAMQPQTRSITSMVVATHWTAAYEASQKICCTEQGRLSRAGAGHNWATTFLDKHLCAALYRKEGCSARPRRPASGLRTSFTSYTISRQLTRHRSVRVVTTSSCAWLVVCRAETSLREGIITRSPIAAILSKCCE